jgi:hypothetical protein
MQPVARGWQKARGTLQQPVAAFEFFHPARINNDNSNKLLFSRGFFSQMSISLRDSDRRGVFPRFVIISLRIHAAAAQV